MVFINWFVVVANSKCWVILLAVVVACSFLRYDSAMVSTAKAENLAIELKLFISIESIILILILISMNG